MPVVPESPTVCTDSLGSDSDDESPVPVDPEVKGSVFRKKQQPQHPHNVPRFVTVDILPEDHHDDYSVSSCASLSYNASVRLIAKAPCCSHSTMTSKPPSLSSCGAHTVSSASISLPILIGPAYKFTPIDRDCSYDDSLDSYEPLEQPKLTVPKPTPVVEEWSLFDLPCLMSRTVCD